jgi:DNA-binding transcriptional regulator YiaG
MINQHRESTVAHVVDQFEATDIGAPFKVFLKNCVKVVSDEQSGEIISYTIPDPDGLVRAVALARILHDRKLFGEDIKFLRKAAGVMQKDLAKAISVSPEHLCKCEAGKIPLSVTSEKLLRVFLLKRVIKHHKMSDKDEKAKFDQLFDKLFEELEPVCVFDVNDELAFQFHRSEKLNGAANSNDDEPEYLLDDVA